MIRDRRRGVVAVVLQRAGGGDHVGLPVEPVARQDADEHFGWMGHFFGLGMTASNARTRALLDWTPTGPTLFEDIAAGADPVPA